MKHLREEMPPCNSAEHPNNFTTHNINRTKQDDLEAKFMFDTSAKDNASRVNFLWLFSFLVCLNPFPAHNKNYGQHAE